MRSKSFVLALASFTLANPASAADDFCSRLFVQAIQQFCQVLPNGFSLCQPVALVGPAPECATPGTAPLLQMPLAAPSVQPFSPWNMPGMQAAATPALPPGSPPPTIARPPEAPVTAPKLANIMADAAKPVVVETPAPPAETTPAQAREVPPASPGGTTTPAAGMIPAKPATAPATEGAPVAATTPPASASEPLTAPAVAATSPAAAAMPVVAAPPVPATSPAPLPAPAAPAAASPQSVAEVVAASDALAHFDFDSALLTDAGRAALDAWLVQAAKGKPVRISGHADRLGPEPYNLKLSLRRAESVKQYLAGKGVNPRRILLEAKGESDPVKRCKGGATPATKSCLAPNRRVKIDPE